MVEPSLIPLPKVVVLASLNKNDIKRIDIRVKRFILAQQESYTRLINQ